ncbi:MAG: c-type cytochrome [Chloroflexota bacterium]
MKPNPTYRTLVMLLLMMLLASCTSFAEDVTPPPGYQPPPPPEATATPEGPKYPPTMPDPERGAPIYEENCAPCHGETGMGDGPSAGDLPNPVAAIGSKDLARQSTPADWYTMVARGNLERYMPPFESLSVTQRWDVLAYVYGLSVTPAEISEGRTLFQESCASCHGDNGDGTGPDAADLTQKPGDFTDQAFMAEKSALMFFETTTQGHDDMPAYTNDLTEAQHWVLASFVRALSFEMDVPDSGSGTASAEPTLTDDQSQETDTPADTTDANVEAETENESGAITVVVTHGMEGDLPDSLDVTLYIYQGMSDPELREAKSSPDGTVVFEDLDMSEGLYYIASVEYENVTFGSNFYQAEPGTVEATLDIYVYDTTTDTEAVTIDRLHIFIEFVPPDVVQVVQLMLLSSSDSRVIAPVDEQGATITFPLPPEADNLWIPGDSTLALFETVDGVGVGNIRPSGEPYELIFAFEMPYQDQKLDLSLPINLNTGAVIVMAPEDGVKIKSDQLEKGAARDLEGMAYQSFSGSSLVVGDLLSISISGWPKSSVGPEQSGEDSKFGLIVGLLVFGATLLGAGFYLWFKSSADHDLDDSYSDLDDIGSPENIIDAIIALDDQYQAGEIPESAYQSRRALLKESLGDTVEEDK